MFDNFSPAGISLNTGKPIARFFNHLKQGKSFLIAFISTVLLLLVSAVSMANTYYLTAAGSANAQIAANWNTNAAGGGLAAANFTTDADIFIIPAGINAVVSANWVFGESSSNGADLTLKVNGSLTINDGIIMTLAQKNAHTTAMTVANGGSLIFLGTTAINQLVGTTAGNASGSNNFTLASGGNIRISNAGAIAGANGAINPSFISVTLNTSANYEFAGGTQTITGLPAVVNDLTISGTGTKTMSTDVSVTGVLTVTGSAVLDADGAANNLVFTLKSSANGTASVAAGNAAGGYITGNVTVERYIADAGHRAWHLLSGKSVAGTQTIYNAWQEGGSNVAGKGTLITSNLYNTGNGFDMISSSASILTHNQGGAAGASWNYNVSNTNTTVLSANQGYMLFVRGDRNYTASNGPAYNTTVLKTTGTLRQGTQSAVTVSATGTGRTLVGNPFASPIDFESIYTTSHLDPNFYTWDPSLAGNYGVGGFRIVERNNNGTYQQTPALLGGGATADANSRYIQSGQAFFLKATGADASVVFGENAKATSLPAINPFMITKTDQQLITNLLVANPDGNFSLTDGCRVRFDASYSAGTADDILKIGNFGENISSYREGKKLIVEKRPPVAQNDTIFLRMTNLVVNKYRFQLATQDFIQSGITAWLQDTYLGTNTMIKTNGDISNIDFTVTTDPASAGQDRFRIVFTTKFLPVSFSNTIQTATNENNASVNVYPNPVVSRKMIVQFTGMAKAIYQLRLINTMGQVVMTQQVSIPDGSSAQTIGFGNDIAAGAYRLDIIGPGNTRIVKAVVITN